MIDAWTNYIKVGAGGGEGGAGILILERQDYKSCLKSLIVKS